MHILLLSARIIEQSPEDFPGSIVKKNLQPYQKCRYLPTSSPARSGSWKKASTKLPGISQARKTRASLQRSFSRTELLKKSENRQKSSKSRAQKTRSTNPTHTPSKNWQTALTTPLNFTRHPPLTTSPPKNPPHPGPKSRTQNSPNSKFHPPKDSPHRPQKTPQWPSKPANPILA